MLSFASLARSGTIQGGSTLLSNTELQQLETWVGEGLTLTNIFSSVPGDGKTANDFHQAADGAGRTIVVVELPAQNGHPRKVIGGYNPQSWESNFDYHYTSLDSERTAFLFNLTTATTFAQKLNAVDGGGVGLYQTYNDFSTGPVFGAGFDLFVDYTLHEGYTYGWSYGPSGFGGSITGGGQGNGGAWLTFGTIEVFAIGAAPSAPRATTVAADNVSGTEATLYGIVNSNLSPTQVSFQYTNDPTFTTGILTTPSQTLDSNAVGIVVSQPVNGLVPETSYYFRVVAANTHGTTTGAVLTFFASETTLGYRFSNIPDSSTGPISNYTIGSQFNVKNSCALTHLGVYDHNQDGLAADMPVGVWNAAGVLLGSTTVLRNDPLNGNCRYHALATPVVLAANTRYFVGAFYPTPDTYGYQPLTFSTDSRINFIGYAYRFGGFVFPNELQGSQGDGFNGYFGPNFLLGPLVKAPIANAGADQNVGEATMVTLDGTGSSDANTPARTLTYVWTQVSGPGVILSNPQTATPTFTTPAVPLSGAALVFNLSVSNGSLTATDTVAVNVANVNNPPTANAGLDQLVGENTIVTLDASLSSDLDDDSLTVQWSQLSGPSVQLDDAGVTRPSFAAPSVTATEKSVDLKFQLVVNDGMVSSGPATVTIRVKNTNDAPNANAGQNQSVNELDLVTLDGSGSSDPDDDSLVYTWTQILGTPTVPLTGGNGAAASFRAPALDLGGSSDGTTLTFELTVSDGNATDTSTVNVRISNVNHLPLADAGADQSVPANTPTTLNGANSADTDGDTLAFAWVQTGGPAVTLSNATASTPTFTTPTVGPAGALLTFQLTVDDGYGGTGVDDTVVNVSYVNHAPIANAGASQTVNEGETAILAGTASDPDGNPLTISWIQLSGPAVTLVGGETLRPSFIAPSVSLSEANLAFRLTVADGYGGSVSSDVDVHVANVNHQPSAQAPAGITVDEGIPVTLIGQGSDPDIEEQSQLSYGWSQVSGPAVTLSGSGATTMFTAPAISAGNDREVLVFRLTVTDPNGAAAIDNVEVAVSKVDHAPIAAAGSNLTVNEASSVSLNGSASSDPDGDVLSYSWEQTDGPAVGLNDAGTAYPYFTAPFVNAAGATLTFKLTVEDPSGEKSSDTVTVAVSNINDPPVVKNAQPSVAILWPPDHRMVKISILGVIDPNGNSTLRITRVIQDEPTRGLGDGDVPVDAVISADRTCVLIRAERSEKGNGRVYQIHFTASDLEASVPGVVQVIVPKSRKTDTAINSGCTFDSTL